MRRNRATGTEEAPSDEVAAPGGMSAGGARASQPALPGAGELVLGGKFRIDESLGKGGMGVVMAGEHITLGQKVAFKFLKPGASEADVVERFVREARAAARIDNEHVVRVSDVGVLESGVAYMLMERLEGEDLSRYLRRQGPLPVDEAVLYLAQACDAVAAAHAAGVIHRDLKPSNLFLARRRDGRSAIKVLDFGISKASSTSRDEVSQSLTRPGTVLGSPRYMSPEQVRDIRNVDGRSDVWSLGTVLYELLVGSPMYEGDTVQALYALIIADPPAPLRSKRPDVPAEIEAAVARCAQKDPNDRFGSVAELALAIAPFGPPEAALLAERAARRLGLGRETRRPSVRPAADGVDTGDRMVSAPAAVLNAAQATSPRRLWLFAFALCVASMGATSFFFLYARPLPPAAAIAPAHPAAESTPAALMEAPAAVTSAATAAVTSAATATPITTAATTTPSAPIVEPVAAPIVEPVAAPIASATTAPGGPARRAPAAATRPAGKAASEFDDNALLNRR